MRCEAMIYPSLGRDLPQEASLKTERNSNLWANRGLLGFEIKNPLLVPPIADKLLSQFAQIPFTITRGRSEFSISEFNRFALRNAKSEMEQSAERSRQKEESVRVIA